MSSDINKDSFVVGKLIPNTVLVVNKNRKVAEKGEQPETMAAQGSAESNLEMKKDHHEMNDRKKVDIKQATLGHIDLSV